MLVKKDQKQQIIQLIMLVVASLFFIKLLQSLENKFFAFLIFIIMAVIAYYRYTQIKRKFSPGIKGDIEKLKFINVSEIQLWLKKNLVGQSENIDGIFVTLARNIKIIQRGRHLGSFLLTGPTGTGKSFFAELLSTGLFGEDHLLIVPMNQFSHPSLMGNLNELIVKSVREKNEIVILLDEIDRAHPDVVNSLFHLIDKGEIVDLETGEHFHIPACVIIATTNAIVTASQKENSHQQLEHAGFEKALLARFDGIFLFDQLNDYAQAQVIILQLRRYFLSHGLKLSYLSPSSIVNFIKANREFSNYGVRQLVRIIKNHTDNIISQAKAAHLETVGIDYNGKEGLVLRVLRKVEE